MRGVFTHSGSLSTLTRRDLRLFRGLAHCSDVIIFGCLTPHRSAANHSNRLRRQLDLIYSSARNGDTYRAQFEYAEEHYRNKRPPETRERLFFR
jgi:hypothetical protein